MLNDCIKKITWDELEEVKNNYRFCLVYNISDMYLGTVPELTQWNKDECVEAYFFDETGQIHVYENEEGEKGIIQFSQQKSNQEFIDQRYELGKKPVGIDASKVVIREYFGTDEDGQNVVNYTRLVCLE